MTTSGWLVALGVLGAINPPRLVPALPRRGRDPRERAATALLGGLLAGAVLLVLALAGGWVAEALSVSAPTMRVAAGLVLVLGALRDVIGGVPAAEPALAGRGAAIVPVAVPFCLRPDVGLLVISAGADGHAPAVGVAVLLAAAGLGAGAALRATSGGAPTVAARAAWWLGGVGHVVAVLVGVALAVSGVLSV